MPEFIADLVSGLLIEIPVDLVAAAIIDWCEMMGDLLIAFACIGRRQFMKTSEFVRMEDVSSGANSAL